MSQVPFRTYGTCIDEDYDSDTASELGDDLIFTPCSSLARRFDTDELVETCDDCGRYFAKCCMHKGICHHSRIVFTDGACVNNGAHGSVSGVGIAMGEPDTGANYQFSIPVDDRLDPKGKRTNQRAELLAALQGLRKVCKQDDEVFLEKMVENGVDYLDPEAPEVIITTDSEYVVKGVTEWLPRWRENGLKKSDGSRPSNIDLFLDLGAAIEACHYRYGCKVEFWRIPRMYNTIADDLAKRAAHTSAIENGRDSRRTTYERSGYAFAL